MSDIVIRAESLSKPYKIGALKQRHDTLRDQLAHSVKTFFSGNSRHFPQPSPRLERYYLSPQGLFLRNQTGRIYWYYRLKRCREEYTPEEPIADHRRRLFLP